MQENVKWTHRDYKLKLSSKRLRSGKYQVKFYLSKPENNGFYGYLLTSGGTSVKDVVARIYDRLVLVKRKPALWALLQSMTMKW